MVPVLKMIGGKGSHNELKTELGYHSVCLQYLMSNR